MEAGQEDIDEVEFASSTENEAETEQTVRVPKTFKAVQLGTTKQIVGEEGASAHSSGRACMQTDHPSSPREGTSTGQARMRIVPDEALRETMKREQNVQSPKKTPEKYSSKYWLHCD